MGIPAGLVKRGIYNAIGNVNGMPTVTTRVTVSADGKTLTATQTGKRALPNGQQRARLAKQ
jgi:hypothetical protein